MTRPLLDFDDAGAGDDEPAKGVTVGDIRAWHDEIERLRAENEQLRAINKDVGVALDIAAGQAKPDLRALLPELAVIAQVMKDTKP